MDVAKTTAYIQKLDSEDIADDDEDIGFDNYSTVRVQKHEDISNTSSNFQSALKFNAEESEDLFVDDNMSTVRFKPNANSDKLINSFNSPPIPTHYGNDMGTVRMVNPAIIAPIISSHSPQVSSVQHLASKFGGAVSTVNKHPKNNSGSVFDTTRAYDPDFDNDGGSAIKVRSSNPKMPANLPPPPPPQPLPPTKLTEKIITPTTSAVAESLPAAHIQKVIQEVFFYFVLLFIPSLQDHLINLLKFN